MKYKYDFCNEAVEIDVPEEWAQVLLNLDREEYNNNQKETRRHSSLEVFSPDELPSPSAENVEDSVLSAMDDERIRKVLHLLPPRERYLIEQVSFAKRSYADIAREEGKAENTIRISTRRAFQLLRKKLLKV